MRNLLAALCFALFAFIGIAHAQTPVLLPSGCGTGNITNAQGYITVNGTAQLCVNAAVSVNGFTPGLTFATLTATNASASVALPAGAVVAFQNTGTTTVSCTLGVGSATALASEIQVPASSTVFMTVGANTFGACIDQTGSTSNLVVLAGGSGLGTGFGGGGGGGGGSSGAVFGPTAVGSANANPPVVIGGTATGAAGQNVQGLAIKPASTAALATDQSAVTNESPNSQLSVATGTTVDAPCASGSTTPCTIEQRLAHIENLGAASVPYTVNGTPTAATALTPGVAQTGTIVAPNSDLTSVGGTAIGAMANFGASPGAVKSPGVNSFGFVTDQVGGGIAPLLGDPCQTTAKSYLPITATTSLVKVIATGVAAKKIYGCQLILAVTAADNVAVFEATTATTCATSPVAVYGAGTSVATAANGFPFPANGGVSIGNGSSTIFQTTVNNNDLCIGTSAATPLTGGIMYVTR